MIFEIDGERLSPERARWLILRHWLPHSIGRRPRARKEPMRKQKGRCALRPRLLHGDVHIDQSETVKEFAEDLSITLTDAILQCWTIDYFRLTCKKSAPPLEGIS